MCDKTLQASANNAARHMGKMAMGTRASASPRLQPPGTATAEVWLPTDTKTGIDWAGDMRYCVPGPPMGLHEPHAKIRRALLTPPASEENKRKLPRANVYSSPEAFKSPGLPLFIHLAFFPSFPPHHTPRLDSPGIGIVHWIHLSRLC